MVLSLTSVDFAFLCHDSVRERWGLTLAVPVCLFPKYGIFEMSPAVALCFFLDVRLQGFGEVRARLVGQTEEHP